MRTYKVFISLFFWAWTLNLTAQCETSNHQGFELTERNFEYGDSRLLGHFFQKTKPKVFLQEKAVAKKKNEESKKNKVFIAYELGEMAFNNFQNFSGEAGVKFKNDNLLRFVYQNVKLSEKHLSSDFARSVDGADVSGLMNTYELFWDFKVFNASSNSKVYFGLSAGFAYDYYEHAVHNASVENSSWTIGFAPSFRETNLFGVKGLYISLAVPFRYYFNPLEETKLGDSTIKKHLFVNNIWFFVGYQF